MVVCPEVWYEESGEGNVRAEDTLWRGASAKQRWRNCGELAKPKRVVQ